MYVWMRLETMVDKFIERGERMRETEGEIDREVG